MERLEREKHGTISTILMENAVGDMGFDKARRRKGRSPVDRQCKLARDSVHHRPSCKIRKTTTGDEDARYAFEESVFEESSEYSWHDKGCVVHNRRKIDRKTEERERETHTHNPMLRV